MNFTQVNFGLDRPLVKSGTAEAFAPRVNDGAVSGKLVAVVKPGGISGNKVAPVFVGPDGRPVTRHGIDGDIPGPYSPVVKEGFWVEPLSLGQAFLADRHAPRNELPVREE